MFIINFNVKFAAILGRKIINPSGSHLVDIRRIFGGYLVDIRRIFTGGIYDFAALSLN